MLEEINIDRPTATPSGKWMLVDAIGDYLHLMDLTKTTPRRSLAWQGTQRQLDAVRVKYPATRNMRPVKAGR